MLLGLGTARHPAPNCFQPVMDSRTALPANELDPVQTPGQLRHYKYGDEATCPTSHSIRAVPIIYHGELPGMLVVVNTDEPAHYTEEELIILESIPSPIAPILQNDRLEEVKGGNFTLGSQLLI